MGEDLVGCVETGSSELSGAAVTVIKALLKGAFHCLIEAAGAALFALSLSKEQPRSHMHAHTHVRRQVRTHTWENLHYFLQFPLTKKIYYSHRYPHSYCVFFSYLWKVINASGFFLSTRGTEESLLKVMS